MANKTQIFSSLSVKAQRTKSREGSVLSGSGKQEEKGLQDREIIELYWYRDEKAIAESEKKYGAYCFSIAYNILGNREDSEECVNDTWLRTWNTVPPVCPDCLSAFLGRVTRNLSFDRWKVRRAGRRGKGETALMLEELLECVPAKGTPEEAVEDAELLDALNGFLEMRGGGSNLAGRILLGAGAVV